MTAPSRSRTVATIDINHLRRGKTYTARTQTGLVAIGEYLGIEVIHSEWRILLRERTGTRSIAIRELESVLTPAA
ncbi:MAG: hypothetical protein GXP34_11305 [Actinobacteria bacterium]|nr:hypothetical protein [Actinomycetota bacterium]